jgi:hypothetical protein
MRLGKKVQIMGIRTRIKREIDITGERGRLQTTTVFANFHPNMFADIGPDAG